MLNEEETKIVKKVIKEMKDAHGVIGFWLKGSPIDATLADWIKSLEKLLPQ